MAFISSISSSGVIQNNESPTKAVERLLEESNEATTALRDIDVFNNEVSNIAQDWTEAEKKWKDGGKNGPRPVISPQDEAKVLAWREKVAVLKKDKSQESILAKLAEVIIKGKGKETEANASSASRSIGTEKLKKFDPYSSFTYSTFETPIHDMYYLDATKFTNIPFYGITRQALEKVSSGALKTRKEIYSGEGKKYSTIDYESLNLRVHNDNLLTLEEFRFAAKKWSQVIFKAMNDLDSPELSNCWEELLEKVLDFPDLDQKFRGMVDFLADLKRKWVAIPRVINVEATWSEMLSHVDRFENNEMRRRFAEDMNKARSSGPTRSNPSHHDDRYAPYPKEKPGSSSSGNANPPFQAGTDGESSVIKCLICGNEHRFSDCDDPDKSAAGFPLIARFVEGKGVVSRKDPKIVYCLAWNIRGFCKKDPCKFQHFCSICGSKAHNATSIFACCPPPRHSKKKN